MTMALPSLLKKHRHRVGIAYFIVGTLFGFALSSFMNNVACTTQDCAQSAIPPLTSLRSSPRCTNLYCNDQQDNGWKLVHVFYGHSRHLPEISTISESYFNQHKWFSQLRQDEVVSALLKNKRNGYFVDLAANDAVKISNTYALEKHFGWNGLCVEPNPIYWSGLSYRKCDVAAVVVGPTAMTEVRFKFPNRQPAQGGIVGEDFDNKESSKFDEDRPRYTDTLLDVFQRMQTPNVIDYLSLDVEGAEDYIMEGFPFSQYRFNVLTVERPSDVLQALLNKNGYKLLKQLKKWGETLWVHASVYDSLDMTALEIDTENYKYREK